MLHNYVNNRRGRGGRRFGQRKSSFPRIAVAALVAVVALALVWTPMLPQEEGGAETHADASVARIFGGMGIGADAVYAADPVYGTYEVSVTLDSTMNYAAIETVFNQWYEDNGHVAPGAAPADYLDVGKLTITGTMSSSAFSFIKGELTCLREIDIASASIAGGAYPNYAFRYLNIEAARIPANVALGQDMFSQCEYLTTVTAGTDRPMVPGTTGVDLVDYTPTVYNGTQQFYDTAVAAVRLPANVPIALSMFRSCENLKTLTIGTAAFTQNLVDLRGYTASSYGEFAFSSTGLLAVRLPGGVSLSRFMFGRCENLSSLSLGDNALVNGTIDLTGYTPASYGANVFEFCHEISKVRVPANVPFSEAMFAGCQGTITLACGDAAFETGVIDLRGYTAASYGLEPFTFVTAALKMRLRADVPFESSSSYQMFGGIGADDAVVVGSGTLTTGVADLTGYTGGTYAVRLFVNAKNVKIRIPATIALGSSMFASTSNVTIACGTTPFTTGVVDLSSYTAGSYGDDLFYNSQITKVRLPVGVPLGNFMFFSCRSLRTLALGARNFEEDVIDLTGYAASSYGECTFTSTMIVKARIPANVPVSRRMFDVENSTCLTSLAVGSAPFQENTIDLTGYTASSYGVGAFAYAGAVRVRVPANIPLSDELFRYCKNLSTFVCGSATFTDGVIDLTGYECASYGKYLFANSTTSTVAKQVRLKGNIPLSQNMFYSSDKITSFTFWGGSAAPAVASSAFSGCATTGTVYYPQGASGYVAGSFGGSSLSKWTFTPRADLVADLGNPPGGGGNKTPLASKVSAAEKLDKSAYTAESWAVLEKAVQDAKAVLVRPDANQSDVDDALGALSSAIEGLVKKSSIPPTQYTVTLNTNGGKAVAAVKRNSGAALGTLRVPTRTGYTFLGWYTSTSGGTKISASTPVKGNVTLWAHWQANNTLKSMKSSKGKLSPAFSPAKASYKIKLTKKQTSTKLTAVKISSGAKLQIKIGKGKWKTVSKVTIKLAKGGKTKVQLRVVCKGLKTKTYSITVTRGR